MGEIYDRFVDTFRDHKIPSIPGSGEHDPVKADIRALALPIEGGIAAAALAGGNMDQARGVVAPLLSSAQAAQAAAEAANTSLADAIGTIPAQVNAAVKIGLAAAVAAATAQAEAARDAVIPIYGTAAPTDAQGQIGQAFYQKTPAGSLIFYGPKTQAGWGDPVSLRGASSGPLGAGSVTADTLSMDATERAAIAGLLPVLQSGRPFVTDFSPDVVPIASGLLYYNADLAATHDLMRLEGTVKAGASAYLIHVTANSEAGTAAGGAVGLAMSGPGRSPTLVVNRYQDGDASALLINKVGTGDRYAIEASYSSLGTGGAGYFIKQNVDGSLTPGAACGLGPSLEIINQSSQGPAIQSLTTANNTSLESNIFIRRNGRAGIIADLRMLEGAERTGLVVGLRVLLQPGAASTGASAVMGADITLGANVTGAGETTGLSLTNLSVGSTNAYGAVIQSLGANTTNRALRLAASGAENNIALDIQAGSAIFGGRVMATLPQYADNAAAAAVEQVGTLYRTATGEVRARI